MSDTVRSGPGALRGFVVKSLCFLLVAFTGLYLPGELFDRLVPWRAFQNPRERILWDAAYDGSSIVILGDSAFCSYYVASPEQTLWWRLEALTGQKVFPGALDGTRLFETALTAKLVARTWPRGTVVFIDLMPTRFISERLANEKRGRNYDSLAALVLDDLSLPAGLSWQRIERRVTFAFKHASFFVRCGERAVGGTLSRWMWPPSDYVQPYGRDLDWRDVQGFARGRFLAFRARAQAGDAPASLEPLAIIAGLLEGSGLRPVFVLTPVNRAVPETFAPDAGVRELRFLDALHARTRGFLDEQRIEFLDLYGTLDPECFVDLIHTNARGDDALARAMADWLRAHPRPVDGD